MDHDRRTQLRGSYAAFASQLNITTVNAVSAAGYAYAYFLAVDANHDRNIELNELGRSLGTVGVNPANPLQVVNQIDPNLSAPRTHEIVAGIDHELMANFGVRVVHVEALQQRDLAADAAAGRGRDERRLRPGRHHRRHAAGRHAGSRGTTSGSISTIRRRRSSTRRPRRGTRTSTAAR